MGEVIPLRQLVVQRGPSDLLGSHRFDLDTDRKVDRDTRLIPVQTLAALRSEIEALLLPAPRDFARQAVAFLGGAFKIAPNTIEDRHAFSVGMQQRLARLPAVAIKHALEKVQDTDDWFPSIKRMVELCNEVVLPLERQRHTIGAMEAEHRRRQAALDRQRAEEKAEAERTASDEARWRQQFGDAAPLPGDIDLAYRLRPSVVRDGRQTLRMALDAGELWAPPLVRRLALARRARLAQEKGSISIDRAATIARLAMTDEARARREVEEIEAGRLQDLTPIAGGGGEFERAVDDIVKAAGCLIELPLLLQRGPRPIADATEYVLRDLTAELAAFRERFKCSRRLATGDNVTAGAT
jgi:hypothetical protein